MTEPTHLNAEELDWLNACKDEAIVVTLFERLDATRRELAAMHAASRNVVNLFLQLYEYREHFRANECTDAVIALKSALPSPPAVQENI